MRKILAVSLLACGGLAPAARGQTPTAADRQKEAFLQTAKVVSTRDIDHGVTKPVRAILTDGKLTHDAQIQVVDKRLPSFFGNDNKPVPMTDCWRFNIAAYRLDRLLGLNMTPPSVQRTYNGKPAAFTWWAEDIAMEEIDRVKKDLKAPDEEQYARQIADSRVFDELIMNIDRNLANMLITKDWRVVLIDHTRTLTAYHGIRNTEKLTRCSRRLLDAMKQLNTGVVSKAAGAHLTAAEITALLARRDRIVEFFEKLASEKGADAVYFD
jgi:hypothetical protein